MTVNRKMLVFVEITTNDAGDRCFSDDCMELCRFRGSGNNCILFEDSTDEGRLLKCKMAEQNSKFFVNAVKF